MKTKQPTFEATLASLEKIVRRLEEGDLQLEESLKLFEEGVRLSRECNERLKQAERRIEVLTKRENSEPRLERIDQSDIDESEDSELDLE